MKRLFLVVAALALAACGTTQPLTMEPARDTGMVVVGTLAPLGSFEWSVAPDYTRLAMTRRLAARALTNGEISVAAAEQVQLEADAARRLLDEAVAAGGGAANVAKAREHIARAQALIGGVR